MLREGVLLGVFSLQRYEVRPFTDKQIELVTTFADQAVIAIENVRLFQELQARTAELTRSVEELRALGEVGRAVSSTLDLETVLNTIVSRAAQLAGADGAAIYEYDDATREFQIRAAHNYDPELVESIRAMPIRLGEGLMGRAAERREPVQVPDIREGAYREPTSRHAAPDRLPSPTGVAAGARGPGHRRAHGQPASSWGVRPRGRGASEDLRHPVRVGHPERAPVPRDRGQEPATRSREPPQVRVPRQHVPRAADAR